MRRVVFFSLFVAFIFSLISCQFEDASSSVSVSVLYPVEPSLHEYQNSDLSFCKVELYGNDGASHVYSASFDSALNIGSLKKADFVARAYGYDSFGSSIAISKIVPVQLDGDTKSIQLEWFEGGKSEDEICYINFDTDGGNSIRTQTIKSGQALEVPEIPQKRYYTFKGWYWNSARTFEFNFGEPVSCNLTLHALWGDYAPEPEAPENPKDPEDPEEALDLSEFYVSESGSDDGIGTEENPFAKVASAISAIKTKNDSSRDYKIWISGTVRETTLLSDLPASSIIISGLTGASSDVLNGDLDGDGNGENTVLTVQTAAPVTLRNLKITGGNANGGGGLFVGNLADVTLEAGCEISGNTSTSHGGGVYTNGKLSMTGGTVSGNTASQNGGGIYIGSGATVLMTGGQIKENLLSSSASLGKGMFADTSASLKLGDNAQIDALDEIYLKDTAIEVISNLSNTSVATITPETYSPGVKVLVGGSFVTSNYGKFEVSIPADGTTWGIDSTGNLKLSIETKLYVSPGGSDAVGVSGLSDSAAVASLDRAVSLLKQYSATDTDLAAKAWTIYLSASFPMAPSTTIEIDSSSAAGLTISGKNGKSTDVIGGSSDFALILKNSIPVTLKNFAIRNCAGGISAEGSAKVTVSGMLISGNTDSGVKISGNGETEITDTTISGNSADTGAGIYKSGSAKLSLTNSTISNNEASADGGGLYIDGGTVEMSAGSIADNTAGNNGGGVCVHSYTENKALFKLTGGTISGNSSTNGNGVAVMNKGAFSMGGDAAIPATDDVYLDTTNSRTISVDGTLSSTSTVATITPAVYSNGKVVLSGSALGSEYTKFEVTPKTGEIWGISNAGKLVQSVSPGITISVPTYSNDVLDLTATGKTSDGSGYTFSAKTGYSSYLWTVNGTVYSTTSNTVTIPKAGLPLTNILMLVATDSAGNVHEAKCTFTVSE